jgi:hypothetical protein
MNIARLTAFTHNQIVRCFLRWSEKAKVATPQDFAHPLRGFAFLDSAHWKQQHTHAASPHVVVPNPII